MGMLVDTFILVPKDIDVCTCICRDSKDRSSKKEKILSCVNYEYREMLSDLIDTLLEYNYTFYLESIMNPSEDNLNLILEVTDDPCKYCCDYDDRYRGDCLKQELRRVFYDTVCIVENDYNEEKTNKFIILATGNIITESDWEKSR